MKVALLGATGFVGSALLKEALDRGHVVTAIVRHPEKLEKTRWSHREGWRRLRHGFSSLWYGLGSKLSNHTNRICFGLARNIAMMQLSTCAAKSNTRSTKANSQSFGFR